jgi:hypothetical protein
MGAAPCGGGWGGGPTQCGQQQPNGGSPGETTEGGRRLRRTARARSHSDRGGQGLTGGPPLQSQVARATDMQVPATVTGGGGLNLDPNANSNEFNQVQVLSNLTRPKKDFP